MAEDVGGERTEPATPRKRQQMRERGQVAKSMELNAAVVLLFAILAIRFGASRMHETIVSLFRYYFLNHVPASTRILELSHIGRFTTETMYYFGVIILPIMAVVALGAILIGGLQTGFLFTTHPLIPKLDKINPIRGLSRFVSVRSLQDVAKTLVKVIIISYVSYSTVRDALPQILRTGQATPDGVLIEMMGFLWTLGIRLVLLTLFIALFDYAYQRWQWERDNRMTRQEVLDETKNIEGDPRIKARIRQVQRQMAMRRMLVAVPEADIVVTNPTEFAVALRYDQGRMEAPMVVAKGQRLMAERIRLLAAEHDVPVVENPLLARTLFKSVEVGQAIPDDLFQAVAELLAYVYQIDNRESKRRERIATAALNAA